MDHSAIVQTRLSDMLKVTSVGEPVNVHVVAPTKEPEPDFDAMEQLVSGQGETKLHEMIETPAAKRV